MLMAYTACHAAMARQRVTRHLQTCCMEHIHPCLGMVAKCRVIAYTVAGWLIACIASAS